MLNINWLKKLRFYYFERKFFSPHISGWFIILDMKILQTWINQLQITITIIDNDVLLIIVLIFSPHRYFFCYCSNTIKVTSVETGDILKTISITPEMGGHKNDITFIRIDSNNVNQVKR